VPFIARRGSRDASGVQDGKGKKGLPTIHGRSPQMCLIGAKKDGAGGVARVFHSWEKAGEGHESKIWGGKQGKTNLWKRSLFREEKGREGQRHGPRPL